MAEVMAAGADQESFSFAIQTKEDAPEHNDHVPEETNKAEIVFTTSGVTASCFETDTVLTAAKAAGLNIANGCNFGVRDLQDQEDRGRGPHGAQRWHIGRRYRGRIHSRLLLETDRARGS